MNFIFNQISNKKSMIISLGLPKPNLYRLYLSNYLVFIKYIFLFLSVSQVIQNMFNPNIFLNTCPRISASNINQYSSSILEGSEYVYPIYQPQYYQVYYINQQEIQRLSTQNIIFGEGPISGIQYNQSHHPSNNMEHQEEPQRRQQILNGHGFNLVNAQSSNQKKKTDKYLNDPDFKVKPNKNRAKLHQARGRNRYSNVYRAFIKLILTKTYNEILKQKIKRISNKYGLQINFEQFKNSFMVNFPTFTNYINRGQFMRFYSGSEPKNVAFRVLFQDFIRNQGCKHILSVTYKKKMKSESIVDFLSALRTINQQLK